MITTACMPKLHTVAPGMIVIDKDWEYEIGHHIYVIDYDTTIYQVYVTRKEYEYICIGDTL